MMDFSNGLLAGDPERTGLLGGAPPQMPGVQMTPSAPAPIPAPAPVAAPQPLIVPHENPRKSLLARVHDALVSGIVGDTPTGFEGALTPDEIAAAKPGLFNAMFGGRPGETGHEMYQENLDSALKNKLNSAAVLQQQRVLAGRQQMYQEIGLPANGDVASDREWVSKALPRLMALGDYEGVKALAPFADKLYSPGKEAKPVKVWQNPVTKQLVYLPDNEAPPANSGLVPFSNGGTGTTRHQYVDPQGHVHEWDPTKGDPDPSWKPVSTNNIVLGNGFVNGRFDQTQRANAVKSFETDIKPLTTKAQALNEAYDVLSTAADPSTPPAVRKTLYGPAISRFVQAVEQSSNLRFQLLQYYSSHLDPSVAGHWNILKARLLDGSLPGYTLQSMLKAVKDMKDVTHNEIESRRTQALKINPDLDGVLPDTKSYFPRFNEAPAAPPAGGKPDINDVEAYLKDLRSKKK